jgi:hypothetical protein
VIARAVFLLVSVDAFVGRATLATVVGPVWAADLS